MIAKKVRAIQKGQLGRIAVVCRVTLDGEPLVAPRSRLSPRISSAPDYKPAWGKQTSAVGTAGIEGSESPGVAPGFYRIDVTQAAGQPELPPRYNRQTELGQEISSEAVGGVVGLALSSR